DKGKRHNGPEYHRCFGGWLDRKISGHGDNAEQYAKIDDMTARQHDRLAGHIAVQFQKGDNRARERNCTNGNAQTEFNAADGQYLASFVQNAKSTRIKR